MNAIIVKPSHKIIFKAVRVGSETVLPDEKRITADKYDDLKAALTNDRFVEIDGEMFNTSEIRSVEKMLDPKKKYPERYMFDTDEEYQTALAVY